MYHLYSNKKIYLTKKIINGSAYYHTCQKDPLKDERAHERIHYKQIDTSMITKIFPDLHGFRKNHNA